MLTKRELVSASNSMKNPKIPLPILILMTMLVQWQPVEKMNE